MVTKTLQESKKSLQSMASLVSIYVRRVQKYNN